MPLRGFFRGLGYGSLLDVVMFVDEVMIRLDMEMMMIMLAVMVMVL